jgi:hypothetical protein
MEFLANNWFGIISVVVITFMALKGNKILGGHVHGGGCCGGSYTPSNPGNKSREQE